jgi:peptidoglycan/LPS O-acetylase OafA/YrhL
MMDVDRRGYLAELQSIRGIAAMVVVFGHASSKFGGPAWWLKAVLVFNAEAAVGMFFVLSGFVLTRMVGERHFTLEIGCEFLIRRLFRIYPALIVATAASLLFVLLFPHLKPMVDSDWLNHQFTDARQSIPFIILAFAGASAHLLPQAWTISVELLGSFLMPAIAWMAFNRVRQLCYVLVVTILLGMTIGPYTPYAVLMYMPHFIIGSLIFVMPSRGRDFLRSLSGGKSAVVLATIVMIAVRSFFDAPFDSPALVFEELGCSAFIVAMLVHGRVSFNILRAPAMEWLGDVSYSLYLFHFVVIYFAIVGLRLVETASGSAPNAVFNNLLLMLVVVVVSLPISAASFRLIERPGNAFGKRLLRWLPPASIHDALRR